MTCDAKRPRCEDCAVEPLCPSSQEAGLVDLSRVPPKKKAKKRTAKKTRKKSTAKKAMRKKATAKKATRKKATAKKTGRRRNEPG
jgi:hypothetical protein